MSNTVIVAIPKEDDYVWKISSEKVPHMTLLFLGDVQLQDEQSVVEYLQHVAKTSMRPFGMSVDRRDVLGPNEADVLIFEKGWGNEDIVAARGYLLADPNISFAYNQAEQHEGWIPHLTLGYPETPANEDDRDYPGTSYVQFDRIALWTGDYSGPEFRLPNPEMTSPMFHSDLALEALQHSGTKGMKWGVRRKTDSSGLVVGSVSGAAKTQGVDLSKPRHGSSDHEQLLKTIKKKPQELSTQEIRDATNRLKAIDSFKKEVHNENRRNESPGKKLARFILAIGVDQGKTYLKTEEGKQMIKELLKGSGISQKKPSQTKEEKSQAKSEKKFKAAHMPDSKNTKPDQKTQKELDTLVYNITTLRR